MRVRGVATLAGDADVPAVGGGQQRAALGDDVAERDAGLVVDGEHRIAGEFVEQAVLDHLGRPAAALFGRLEDKVHGALEVALFAQDLGGAQQHGGVAVMAAGMHPAEILRAVLEIVGFVHRQAVHVGAQSNRLQRIALAQSSHQAGLAQPARHFEAPLRKLGGDDVGGPVFLVGQLGMGVDVTTDGGNLALDFKRTRQNRHLVLRLERHAS